MPRASAVLLINRIRKVYRRSPDRRLVGPLDPKRRGQQAERECDGEKDNLKNSVDRDTQDTERDQQEPHERVGYQRQDRQRPAEYEEGAQSRKVSMGDLRIFL